MTNPGSGGRIYTGARRRALRIGTPIAVIAVIAAGTAQAAEAAGASAASHTPTAVGSLVKAPAGAKAAAAPSDSTETTISVELTPRNASLLQQYADEVSNPKSSDYKHYLSAQQAASDFAPTKATVQSVENALVAAGLKPGAVGGDNLDIQVSASLGQLKQAFGIGFDGYKLADGRTAYAANAAPKIDGTVAPLVQGVVGLNDFADHTPDDKSIYGKGAVSSAPVGAKKITSDATAPQMCTSLANGLANFQTTDGVIHMVDGTNYYSPASLDTVYGLNSQLAAGNVGAGQTVAVVEWETVSQPAVNDYFSCFGLQNQVAYTPVDGGPYTQPTYDNEVGVESALDIETIASLAPGAKIIDYMGPDGTGPNGPTDFTDADWLDTMMAPVSADQAGVISMSWSGGCEAQNESDQSFELGETDILRLAATQGQTFVNSSGDDGSTECARADPSDGSVNPADPSDNPYILAVGGTYDQGISSVSTTTWNDSGIEDGASGGGVSNLYTLPTSSDYQAGFTGPGYSSTCQAAAGYSCRETPDVSALADEQSGAPIIYYDNGTNYYYTVEGGTSWATPIVAAMIALSDNTSACKANGALGFINPALYSLAHNSASYAADFTDVTVGDNAYTPDNSSNSLYSAGQGYDMATGLGVVNESGWLALCQNQVARTTTTSTPVYALGPNKNTVQEWNGSAWVVIGGPAGAIYAGGAGVFASSTNGQQIFKYDGSPNLWTLVGGSGETFVVSGDTLYGLGPKGSDVAQWTGSGTAWNIVGGAAQWLYSAADGVFATSPGNSAIFKYTPGSPWFQVGGPGSQFATSGDKLFGLGPKGAYVAEWNGTGQNWTVIGGAAHALFGGGLGLFATDPGNDAVSEFNGTPNAWTRVGGGGANYAVSQQTLYGQGSANASVFEYSGTPGQWANIGLNAVVIVGG